MSRTVEIIGTYQRERFRFMNPSGPTIVGEIRLHPSSKELAASAGVADVHGPIGVKGEASDDDLQPDRTYRFLGSWTSYFNKRLGQAEKQFAFRTFVHHVPHDPDSITHYLTIVGRGKGIGPAKARRLVTTLGVEAVLEVCRTQPDQVAEITDISTEQAEAFSSQLRIQAATENATLEVDRLLTGRGFPRTLGKRCIKEWGNLAAETIVNDPYQLMQFPRVGFQLCDKLYIELGKDPRSVDRQALCLWYGMASDSQGHVWFPAQDAAQRLRNTIGGDGVDPRAAIVRGREYGQLSEDHYGAIASIRTDGENGPITENGKNLWLAEGKYAAAEETLARLVVDCLQESASDRLTLRAYDEQEVIESRVLNFARCARCHRALTAETVHVVDGKPYGPTCVGYVL